MVLSNFERQEIHSAAEAKDMSRKDIHIEEIRDKTVDVRSGKRISMGLNFDQRGPQTGGGHTKPADHRGCGNTHQSDGLHVALLAGKRNG